MSMSMFAPTLFTLTSAAICVLLVVTFARFHQSPVGGTTGR